MGNDKKVMTNEAARNAIAEGLKARPQDRATPAAREWAARSERAIRGMAEGNWSPWLSFQRGSIWNPQMRSDMEKGGYGGDIAVARESAYDAELARAKRWAGVKERLKEQLNSATDPEEIKQLQYLSGKNFKYRKPPTGIPSVDSEE